jgi:guanylate kinase
MSTSSHDTEHAWDQGLPDLRSYLTGGNPLLIIISGPSGAGKDAIVKRMEELGYPFYFVITATTRAPRQGEQGGVDYFFLSEAEFLDLINRGELLEHALVYGEHKGVPKQQVRQALASGRDVVMRLDVQGAATVRALVPDAILVFLIPGSEEELLQRLHGRKTETAAELQRRVKTMREEMKRIPEFDYVVVNRDGQLDRAVEAIVAIMHAEKCRTKQREIRL